MRDKKEEKKNVRQSHIVGLPSIQAPPLGRAQCAVVEVYFWLSGDAACTTRRAQVYPTC
jgi:hypothetical protein